MSMSSRSQLARKCLAEFLGVLILCTFGNGSVAIAYEGFGGVGTWLEINLAYGFAVTLAVHVTGKVSGGHINPAVSLAETLSGRLKWIELFFYTIAQILGAFASSMLLYGMYFDMPKDHKTAGIFATYPRNGVALQQAFMTEMVGTLFLVLCVRSLTDKNNNKPASGLEPFFIGITVFTIGASMGLNTGYAINPARDFGPRLFTFIFGWPDTFARGNDKYGYHFWIPIVAPLVGANLGAFLYKYAVEDHLESETKGVKENESNSSLTTNDSYPIVTIQKEPLLDRRS